MEEVSSDKPQKYSLVTGEKIKKKRIKKLKKEHKKQAKLEETEEKKFNKRKKHVDKKLSKKTGVTVESKTVSNVNFSNNDSEVNELALHEMGASDVSKESRREVLVVRRAEKGRPVTKKKKLMNLLSYALVGFVAIFFGYISGNFYVANVLNKVDYSVFSEDSLRDDNKAVYERVLAANSSILSISAGDLFMAGEYVLSIQENYYATTLGAIQPSIGSTQDVWGYKKKTGNVYECESASKGMLALAEKYFYNLETKEASIYKASKVNANGCVYEETPTWVMNLENYKKEYGTSPDSPAIPYIISSKTILPGTESVQDLGSGRYQISFKLTTDSSVINYIKQVKHMSGLQDYPTFKNITVTAIINSNFRFEYLRFDESYTVMYFGVMATCSGYVESRFNY